ncbi:MAG: hypothetical protein MJZ76_05295 [Bacteroidales bacterium]|nr:hypothetical protein [Bacteroidales bacterium]
MAKQTDKSPETIKALQWVYRIVVLIGIFCFLKIVWLIFFQRSLYLGTSDKCLDKTKPGWDTTALAKQQDCKCIVVQTDIHPTRGEIFDDKGRNLVGNYAIFDVTLDGRMLIPKEYQKGQKTIINDTIYCGNGRNISRNGEPQKVDALIKELAQAFYEHFHQKFPQKSLKFYEAQFTKAIKDQKNVLILQSQNVNDRHWITSEDTAFIAKLPLLCRKRRAGLHYDITQMRITPYGELGKRTLGMYYIPTDTGIAPRKYGLEAAFNEYLAGINGAQKALFVNHTRIPLNDRTEPIDGYNVNTTINLEIQNIVHTELQKILIDQRAEWGCAVVMETRTGEIKAISNLRRADTSCTSYIEAEKNYALKAMVEPGSTFKLASLLAYLERTPNDTAKKYPILAHTFIRKSKSGREYSYFKFDEKGRAEDRGLAIDAFQRSSNVGISSMIFDTYSIDNYSGYLAKLDSMSVTTSFKTQLGMIDPPNILRKATDFHSYYNTCFGTGFTMAPMRTLVLFNAVANDGKMIAPIFVKSITDHKDTIKKFKSEVICEQICKPSTIKRAKKYLEAVVYGEHGTARLYKKDTTVLTFAGKTGTRDIWDEKTQSYLKNKNSVSFCGYFPIKNPKYTCLIFIYNVSKKSSIAVKAFTNIAMRMTAESNIIDLKEVDKTNGRQIPRFAPIPSYQKEVLLNGFGIANTKNEIKTPYINTGFDNDNKTFIKSYPYHDKDKRPSVKGLNGADAVYELSKKGYRVKIKGIGFVKEESYDATSKTVTLLLEPN